MKLKEKVIEVLKQCFDPEIPVDLWNLGLIYDIKFDEFSPQKTDVKITMSLTTPGCSMGNQMANDIKEKVSAMDEINDVNVNVTFDPPWKPEMMSDEARNKLGFDPTPVPKSEPKIEMEWE
ncbi:MAG: metal-sulfur cluster assembly factor [Candidatus Marinimicrobia bacterium]|jgi:metal-sulfur cluster biosynthetic enzyme|nr:metal-sulfur cluster assembly factor [Candidatus Neomarinimicrobiota bacterium]MBT5748984.1 metal-sulfur cluster assembly factor [Candidatus Neomarinimicrobiota bacterium]MBT7043004.1 metal-sulfur cluster assembly factor [Candidatus Neomarinimicrobiota bacterium]